MVHVMYCYIGWIVDRTFRTKETLFNLLLNYGSREMGHDGVASGYPTPTGFHRLTGCQRDPRDRGVTSWYQSLGTQIPRTQWGIGLDHAFIMHFDELMCVICA